MLSPVSTDAVAANMYSSDDAIDVSQVAGGAVDASSSPSNSAALKNFEICICDDEDACADNQCGDENNNNITLDFDCEKKSAPSPSTKKMHSTSNLGVQDHSPTVEGRARTTSTDENYNLGNNLTISASMNVDLRAPGGAATAAGRPSAAINYLSNTESLSAHPASPIDLTTPKELRTEGGRQRRRLSSNRAVAAADCIDLTTPSGTTLAADSKCPNIRMHRLRLSDTGNGEEDPDDDEELDDDDDLQITDDDLRGAGTEHVDEQEILEIDSPMARPGHREFSNQQEAMRSSASCDTSEETDSETQEARLAREQAESEALARQLMEEEAMANYARHTEYLHQHSNQFSEEDLQAIRAAMEEDGAHHADELAEEQAELLGDSYDSNDLSYETLLRLGERMGNVKQERWTLEASKHIAKCPTYKFDPEVMVGTKNENDSSVKCLVCQHPYESGEELRQLPCQHVFHTECVDQWLASNDCCPYCRQCIVAVAKSPADKSKEVTIA